MLDDDDKRELRNMIKFTANFMDLKHPTILRNLKNLDVCEANFYIVCFINNFRANSFLDRRVLYLRDGRDVLDGALLHNSHEPIRRKLSSIFTKTRPWVDVIARRGLLWVGNRGCSHAPKGLFERFRLSRVYPDILYDHI